MVNNHQEELIMTTPPEETIKKLERRISSLEKQVQDITESLKIIQERTNFPLSPGFDRCPVMKHPRRR
jgi:chaperonin cofactor prefoldin